LSTPNRNEPFEDEEDVAQEGEEARAAMLRRKMSLKREKKLVLLLILAV
jgi:hypothetical protein